MREGGKSRVYLTRGFPNGGCRKVGGEVMLSLLQAEPEAMAA